jgi:Na+-driven multidrug efflux pump
MDIIGAAIASLLGYTTTMIALLVLICRGTQSNAMSLLVLNAGDINMLKGKFQDITRKIVECANNGNVRGK